MADKLRGAIIGLGGMGGGHFDACIKKSDKIDLVAAVDTDPDRLASAKSKLSDLATYTDAVQMFNEVAPELTIIAVPHFLHYHYIVMALLAGSHVLCEKPLVESRREFDYIVELANARGLIVATGFNKEFDWRVQKTFSLIDQLGQLDLIKLNDAWHHAWLYDVMTQALSEGRKDWRSEEKKMFRGGFGTDSGVHSYENIVRFANGLGIHLDYVYADTTYLEMMEGPDTVHVLGHYDNGCRFEAFGSWAHTLASIGSKSQRWHYPLLEVFGRKGNIKAYDGTKTDEEGKISHFAEVQLQIYPDLKTVFTQDNPESSTALQLESVYRSIRYGDPVVNSLDHVGKVIDLTQRIISAFPQAQIEESAAD